MKKNLMMIALVAGCMALGSCVSKKEFTSLQNKYDRLKAQKEQLGEKYTALQSDYNTANMKLATCSSESKSLATRLEEEKERNRQLRESYDRLQGSYTANVEQGNVNISKLVDEINASNKFIKQLVEAKSKSDSLNITLTNNLTRSLTREELILSQIEKQVRKLEDVVDIKVLKGVVYISLADNMLYKSGSYEIGPRAGETLGKIAKIIMDYKEYDVLVEGNTDNVPISQKNIRNNWDLSCLRASSVVQALQKDYGVDPKRLSAAGRGEYNPIADNTSAVGKQRNRRTQIIITPKLDEFMELIEQAPEQEEGTQDAMPQE